MFRCKHHLQGSQYLSSLKLRLLNGLKHIDGVNSVVWLRMLLLGLQ